MLHVIVCIKQVLDPEAPISAYKIDDQAKRVICRGVPPVISTFDESALEAALRIKDVHESKVSVISMGQMLAKAVLRRSLAVGADELFLLEDEAFGDLDSYATAVALTAVIRKLEQYDLIFTGLQAADTNAGVVGSGIAEFLGIPSITTARRVQLNGRKLVVERVGADGYEVLEADLPLLVTVSNELGKLRPCDVRELIAAKKKPTTTWKANDIGIEPRQNVRAKLLELFIPQRKGSCEFIDGETPEDAGSRLALKLSEAGIMQRLDILSEKCNHN